LVRWMHPGAGLQHWTNCSRSPHTFVCVNIETSSQITLPDHIAVLEARQPAYGVRAAACGSTICHGIRSDRSLRAPQARVEGHPAPDFKKSTRIVLLSIACRVQRNAQQYRCNCSTVQGPVPTAVSPSHPGRCLQTNTSPQNVAFVGSSTDYEHDEQHSTYFNVLPRVQMLHCDAMQDSCWQNDVGCYLSTQAASC
jgi:hypothetical protein